MDSKFDSKLISLVEENLEYYLNIYAALPGGSINRELDLTWIITDVPNKFVNILYGARFRKKELSERIEIALQPYLKRKNPVHWWVGPRTCPSNLYQILGERGFTLSLELNGMFAYRHLVILHSTEMARGLYEKFGFKPICKLSAYTPTLQKSDVLRVKASEVEVVVLYFKPSETQNLKSSGFPEGEKTGKNLTPSIEFTHGGIQEFVILI